MKVITVSKKNTLIFVDDPMEKHYFLIPDLSRTDLNLCLL